MEEGKSFISLINEFKTENKASSLPENDDEIEHMFENAKKLIDDLMFKEALEQVLC